MAAGAFDVVPTRSWTISRDRVGRLGDRRGALLRAAGAKRSSRHGAASCARAARRRTTSWRPRWRRSASESGPRRLAGAAHELNADHPPTPEAMRDGTRNGPNGPASFLRETGWSSFPAGEECGVEPSPPFQRPVLAVASYSSRRRSRPDARPLLRSVPARRRIRRGDPAATREELATRHPDESVHEAYPGHHWHLVTAQAIRSRFGSASGRRTSPRAGGYTRSR